MPYIIDVKTPRATARTANGRAVEIHERRAAAGKFDYDVVSSVSVEDIDSARAHISLYVCDRYAGENFGQCQDEFCNLDDMGGSIDLPDGYVIDVRFVSFGNLWKETTGSKNGQPIDTDEIIDAYNAAQTV